jgi:glycosyltransferase involved in cell wall biosynthesis
MPIEGSLLKRISIRAKNWLYTLAERRAAKHCHVIVSVADAMTREYIRRSIGLPEQYITVYSGMEVERFEHAALGESRDDIRAALGLDPSAFVVGTVARLAQHKGHDDLLDALAHRVRESSGWKLLWVGDGWWRERLLKRAADLGLRVALLERNEPASTAHIIITGLVPPEHVPKWMRAMDVLAHPSMREGLPRTVPQALLCGVMPVAYDADGTREACIDMTTGRLVRAGDLAGLRDAIIWACDNPSERARLTSAGRDLCRTRFAARTMVEELERVYQRARS